MLFHERILGNSSEYGDDSALTDDTSTIVYSELNDLVRHYSLAFDRLGLSKGDSILVALPNCNEYPLIFLGAARIGCILSGVSNQLNTDEICTYGHKCEARLLIIEDDLYFDHVLDDTKVLSLSTLKNLCVDESPDPLDLPEISLDDVILQPFSSGTSGIPKCVQLTHRNFIAATESLSEGLFSKLTSQGRRTTLAILPLFHGSGFWALMYCLLEGHHTVIQKEFYPLKMLKTIQDYKIDTINVVPSILHFLCRVPISNFDVASLKTVLCGSAPLGRELSVLFMNTFPGVTNLIQGYGMTEVVVLSHIVPLDAVKSDDTLYGSCGKLLPGFDCKLTDDDGEEVHEPHKWGEIWLKSEAVMKGYKDEEECECLEGDWLKTGDIAYFDENGYYFIVDRVKDLIKVNGMQVSPSEIEDVILSHPDVKECAVVRWEHPQLGEVPRGFVVLKEGCQCLPDEFEEMVRERLSAFKHLKGGISIIDQLPRTSSGKINRRAIRDTLNEFVEETAL